MLGFNTIKFGRFMANYRGGSRGWGAPGARPSLKLEKIWFFGVLSWFFTRNTPTFFAPPSARRNFLKFAPPLTWNPGSTPGQYKNKNKNFLLPIKGPQGANNLIQWLKWLETYKDTCKHTQKEKKKNQNQKNQENIFMLSDCTARSEPIKYHHKSIHI